MKLSPRDFTNKVNKIIQEASISNAAQAIKELKKPNPLDDAEHARKKKKKQLEKEQKDVEYTEAKKKRQEQEEEHRLMKQKVVVADYIETQKKQISNFVSQIELKAQTELQKIKDNVKNFKP